MAGCSGCSSQRTSTAVEDAFVGVRFGEETNLTLCRTGGSLLGKGDRVIVELEDDEAYTRKVENESQAKQFCREKAKKLQLEMKISRVDFLLTGRHATFYFTASRRVDFRQLVRDLSQRFSARIKMVQVGARDEAGLLGGIGCCGLTLCCSTWLEEFKPISIQMAKRQNLSLNPSKISGQCGRLLCCMAYENPRYQQKARCKAEEETGEPR